MTLNEEIFETCWLFIRGDMPTREFESWVYETSELQAFFPENLYMNLISIDYASSGAVLVLKQKLEKVISRLIERNCYCHTLSDVAAVGMGQQQHDNIFKSLDPQAKYGNPLWWLSLYQCNICEQFWMVGSEERINDVSIMKRLSLQEFQQIITGNLWPDDFKKFASLLRIGKERGYTVEFVDPVSPALVYTVIDLAMAKPRIHIQEISALLQVDLVQAEAIVSEAKKQNQLIQITL